MKKVKEDINKYLAEVEEMQDDSYFTFDVLPLEIESIMIVNIPRYHCLNAFDKDDDFGMNFKMIDKKEKQ
jgi:hypothetical protein